MVGECFRSLIQSDATESIPFIERFLGSKTRGIPFEAAGTLAESREIAALEIVMAHWNAGPEPDVRQSIVASCGASPLREAAEFLLQVVDEGKPYASSALIALASSRYREEFRDRAEAALRLLGDARAAEAWEIA